MYQAKKQKPIGEGEQVESFRRNIFRSLAGPGELSARLEEVS